MKAIITILLLGLFAVAMSMPGPAPEEVKCFITGQINSLRRSLIPASSNMQEIVWDNCLAGLAENFMGQCRSANASNTNRNIQAMRCGYSKIEESIIHREMRFDAFVDPVGIWLYEERDFEYGQLINAENFAIGCAYINREFCGDFGMTITCYFAGAAGSDLPYEEGMPCSQCGLHRREQFGCNYGLCLSGLPNTLNCHYQGITGGDNSHSQVGIEPHEYEGPEPHEHAGPKPHEHEGPKPHEHAGPKKHEHEGPKPHEHEELDTHDHVSPYPHQHGFQPHEHNANRNGGSHDILVGKGTVNAEAFTASSASSTKIMGLLLVASMFVIMLSSL